MEDKPVYVCRGAVMLEPLRNGAKVASVSSYSGNNMLHIRRYCGENHLKFPTKDGIVLTRAEYEQLVSMKDSILEAF